VEPKLIIDNTIKMTEEKISDIFLVTKEFHTSTEFSQFIEKMAFNTQSPCMDIVVDYCIKKEIEIESISKFLTASLKSKIKEEALDLNLLKEKRKNKLPL
jgi:hypothetical protein|tara:strand:+ start:361 stop:660 length:300 start_codon:yes stop_codon:yes gene_type:complete